MHTFQSTRPRGARPGPQCRTIQHQQVSIHAPARGATRNLCAVTHDVKPFQSTRPRGARLDAGLIDVLAFGVSIHAPARGATVLYGAGERVTKVSIHAPARGATRVPFAFIADPWCFNPRAREGRDDEVRDLVQITAEFQSTRPRGARQAARPKSAAQAAFQSTRPRGARPSTRSVSCAAPAFQSTRPRGARHGCKEVYSYDDDVSIHAPARGATPHDLTLDAVGVFQSTRPRGARHDTRRGGWPGRCFNPRAREGRDARRR